MKILIQFGSWEVISGNMFRLRFDVDGDVQLSRYLDIMADHLNDFRPLFEDIADDFRETEKGIFSSEGAFEGNAKWKPLSPTYKAIKDKQFPGKPILQRRGDLMQSLTSIGGNHVSHVSSDSLEIGTKDPKAVFHQRGTSKMPQRKVVSLTAPQKRRWTRLAFEYIFEHGGST